MKNFTCFLLLSLFLFDQSLYAQKGIDFTVGGGAHFTPIAGPMTRSAYFQGEMEYHQTPRLSFSVGIITSNFTYPGFNGSTLFPNGTIIPGTYDRLNGTELQSNFLAKYALLKKQSFTLRAGAGIGLVSYSRQVLVTLGREFPAVVGVSNTDIGFPIQLEAEQKVYKNILLGLRAGTFVFPDYPFVGNHTGLVVKYRLK